MWSRIAGRHDAGRKVRVVAAVRSEGLARLIGHLLVEADDLESYVGVPKAGSVLSEISRLAPDIIVATLSSLGPAPADRIADIRAAYPASRLLLIASAEEGAATRSWDADAQIPEEALVATLLFEIGKLARTVAAGRGPG